MTILVLLTKHQQKEPWVSWNEKNIASISKSGEKLIELESDVNTGIRYSYNLTLS